MTIINKYNNIIIKYIHIILSLYLFPCWFVGLLVGDFKKFSAVFFIFSFSSITGGVGDFYFYSISFLIQLATVGIAAQHTQTDPNVITHS